MSNARNNARRFPLCARKTRHLPARAPHRSARYGLIVKDHPFRTAPPAIEEAPQEKTKRKRGNGYPECIKAKIIEGPDYYSLWKAAESSLDSDGNHRFLAPFTISYLKTQRVAYACVKGIRPGSDNRHYYLNGYIKYCLPGDNVAEIRHFTATYALKPTEGEIRIHTKPCQIKTLEPKSDPWRRLR